MTWFRIVCCTLILCGCAQTPYKSSHNISSTEEFTNTYETLLLQAQAGDRQSMQQLGYLYLDKKAPFYDINRGLEWLEKSVLNSPDHQSNADVIEILYEAHPNKERRTFWLMHAAKYNDMEAIARLFLNPLNKLKTNN